MAESIRMGQSSTHDRELGKRDATHVPTVKVVCHEKVKPSDRMVFTDDECTTVKHAKGKEDWDGIADPLHDGPIDRGHTFLLVVNPAKVETFTHSFNIAGKPSQEELIRQRAEERANGYDRDDSCSGCYN